jgi:hypothetical protein
VLHSRALAAGETLSEALADLLDSLRHGSAKRDFTDGPTGRATLAGAEAEERSLHHVLDAGRVEYIDPYGRRRTAGDEALSLQLRVLAAEREGHFLAAWLIGEESRIAELDREFQKVLASLQWKA